MKYCLNCKQNVEPNKNTGMWIAGALIVFVILLLLSPIAGLLWLFIAVVGMAILYQFADEKCPICHSKNFRNKK